MATQGTFTKTMVARNSGPKSGGRTKQVAGFKFELAYRREIPPAPCTKLATVLSH